MASHVTNQVNTSTPGDLDFYEVNSMFNLPGCSRYERFIVALEEASKDNLLFLKEKALKVCLFICLVIFKIVGSLFCSLIEPVQLRFGCSNESARQSVLNLESFNPSQLSMLYFFIPFCLYSRGG